MAPARYAAAAAVAATRVEPPGPPADLDKLMATSGCRVKRTGRAAVASYTGKQLADGARSTFITLPIVGFVERLNPSPLRPIPLDCVYYSGRAPMDVMTQLPDVILRHVFGMLDTTWTFEIIKAKSRTALQERLEELRGMRVEDHHITGRQSAWWDTLHIVERELLRIRMAVEASGSNILSGSEVHYVAPPADQLHGSGAVHFAKNWEDYERNLERKLKFDGGNFRPSGPLVVVCKQWRHALQKATKQACSRLPIANEWYFKLLQYMRKHKKDYPQAREDEDEYPDSEPHM